MIRLNQITLSLFFISLLLIALSGCSSRRETPVTTEDSTIVYPPNKVEGINAKISFCKKISKKTGEKIGQGTAFTINEKTKVYAIVELEDKESSKYQELMFHIDWIGPNGKSFYKKRIDIAPTDSSSTIKSSISTTPDKRQPGIYIFRVFLFRELIAEKKFELQVDKSLTGKEFDINTNITLYRKLGKKTGKRIGAGTNFTIKKKTKVKAVIELVNRNDYTDSELKFNLDWIGPNGKSFYRKEIELAPEDSSTSLKSSISISPEKRKPGNYTLRFYLFKELIAEKNFKLHAESHSSK
jgi:hypothetical protein